MGSEVVADAPPNGSVYANSSFISPLVSPSQSLALSIPPPSPSEPPPPPPKPPNQSKQSPPKPPKLAKPPPPPPNQPPPPDPSEPPLPDSPNPETGSSPPPESSGDSPIPPQNVPSSPNKPPSLSPPPPATPPPKKNPPSSPPSPKLAPPRPPSPSISSSPPAPTVTPSPLPDIVLSPPPPDPTALASPPPDPTVPAPPTPPGVVSPPPIPLSLPPPLTPLSPPTQIPLSPPLPTHLSPPPPPNAPGHPLVTVNPRSPPTTPLGPSSSEHPHFPIEAVIGAIVAGVIVVVALAAIVFVIISRRKKKSYTSTSMKPDGSPSHVGGSYGIIGYHPGVSDTGGSKSWFTYEELKEITDGFSQENLLGEGGFGCVYKGCLSDGKLVAVKQLKVGSGQGEREFKAEVEIISRVHHRHLVSLVGYCIAEQHRMLVYEYVPNKTLEYHLHGKGLPVMEWTKRLKIASGSARGLAYLHQDCHPRIIHRDIKSANILLDEYFEAQVADFGLAKLTDDANTHVSTRVVGTFGYMAPEYAASGKLTDRSDVFSFGVVLLELITGRKPVDASQPLGEESLVEWARPLLVHTLETGDCEELVDTRLENNFPKREMLVMIEAAAACVRHSASKRPRMVQVVRALDTMSDMSDLSNGVKYGQSAVYNSAQYSEEIRRFQRPSFSSGEDIGSEYSISGEHERRIPIYSGEVQKKT